MITYGVKNMDILVFMADNPWLSFFCLLLILGALSHIVTAVKEMFIHTIWCIRGNYPIAKSPTPDMKDLEESANKVTEVKTEKGI